MLEHKNQQRAPLRPLDLPTLALTVGGLGFLRPAPGTWGSVPPAALAVVLVLANVPLLGILWAMGACTLLASVVCVVWGRYAERRFGRRDAAEVVADETAGAAIVVAEAGYWIGARQARAEAALENGGTPDDLLLVAAIAAIAWAFVLFRVMDILKPWPVRRLERLPHGWGVLIDDLVAGLYALVLFNLTMFGAKTIGMW